MLEATGFLAVLLIVGVLVLAVKLLLALLLIPLKLGVGTLKILLLLLLGIPLLIIGCVAVGVALPFLLAGGLVLAVLIAPLVLLVKAIS